MQTLHLQLVLQPQTVYIRSICTHYKVYPSKTSSDQVWDVLLGKARSFFTWGQNPNLAITTNSGIFALSLCLKPPFSDCKVGCKLNQKGGILPRPTGEGRWGEELIGRQWRSPNTATTHAQSYTSIIPPARLWRQMLSFISQECDSWQVCTTQAFHFTSSGFSGSSQAQGFTSHEPSNTPPAERMARAGVSGGRSVLSAPGFSPPTLHATTCFSSDQN